MTKVILPDYHIFLATEKEIREIQAISFDPFQSAFHASLGATYKPKKQAIIHYKKALELNPGCIASLLELSQYYFFELNDRKKAFEYAHQALTFNPMDSYALTIMGFILHAKGDYIAVKEHAVLAIGQDPSNKDVLKLICLLETKNIIINSIYRLGLSLHNKSNKVIFYISFIPLCIIFKGLNLVFIAICLLANFSFKQKLRTNTYEKRV